MARDHLRQDAVLWGNEQVRAWDTWDFAIVSAQALGWQLMQLTHRLIGANCNWGAQAVAEVDRKMYLPTAQLAAAGRVTRACAAASAWERAIVASGIDGILLELDRIARNNQAVEDAVAGWRERVQRQRDLLAGAALELRSAYRVAVDGGPRPDGHSEADSLLI